MAEKNYSEITIEGKTYKLGGTADEAYLQQLSDYVNGKYAEMHQNRNFGKMSPDRQTLMLHLNMADDYLQAMNKVRQAEARMEEMEQEIYDLKHELVSNLIQKEKEQNGKKPNSNYRRK